MYMYHCSLNVLMTSNTPSGTKKHQTRKQLNGQNVFHSSFFFFLVQKLCDSFTTVFTQTASYYTEQCTSHCLFATSSNVMKCSKDILNYGFAWVICIHICTKWSHKYMYKTQQGPKFSVIHTTTQLILYCSAKK